MNRVAIPSFVPASLLFLALAGVAVVSLASFQLATAHADMAPTPEASVSIAGNVAGDTLVYRLTNTGGAPVEIAQPHLVVMDRGVRLPLRVASLQIDGAAHGVHDAFTVAPGQTVVVRIAVESLRHGEVELSFYRGNVRPYRMSA